MNNSKSMNVDQLFTINPSNENELNFKSNIIDVSHFLGYGNADKGREDKQVLEIASTMFDNGLMTFPIYKAYIMADNKILIEGIEKLSNIFNVSTSNDLNNLTNKQLYKKFGAIIKEAYNAKQLQSA